MSLQIDLNNSFTARLRTCTVGFQVGCPALPLATRAHRGVSFLALLRLQAFFRASSKSVQEPDTWSSAGTQCMFALSRHFTAPSLG